MKKPLSGNTVEQIHELFLKPFEVLYESANLTTYEVMIDPTAFSNDKKNGYSGSLEDWIRRQKGKSCAVEITHWTVENALFRCGNRLGNGLELFIIMSGKCERAPDFLTPNMKDSERDCDRLHHSQRYTFSVDEKDGGRVRLDEADDTEDFEDEEFSDFEEEEDVTDFEEYEHAGPSIELYDLDGHPILILDAEDRRIKINHLGYEIDEQNKRTSDTPLIKYPREIIQEFLKGLSKKEKLNLLRADEMTTLGRWFYSE